MKASATTVEISPFPTLLSQKLTRTTISLNQGEIRALRQAFKVLLSLSDDMGLLEDHPLRIEAAGAAVRIEEILLEHDNNGDLEIEINRVLAHH